MSIKTALTSSNSNKRYIKPSVTGSSLSAGDQEAIDFYSNIVVAQYMMVGGGGAAPTDTTGGGGGGGAGMFTQGNVVLTKNVATIITVGAGQAGGGNAGGVKMLGDRGSTSTILQNQLLISAIGGGMSGSASANSPLGPSWAFKGYPGGSGGGGDGNPSNGPYPGGVAVYGGGTGYPGGQGGNNGGGRGGGGGGAGSAGVNLAEQGQRSGGNGVAVSWVPDNYGTPGPTPGRWFAGGGGGAFNAPLTPTYQRSFGGAGGGGDGGSSGLAPVRGALSGNVNTGGGGGGFLYNGPTTNTPQGGSGIVIFTVPTSQGFVNLTGGTITTGGVGNVIAFTSSGQITFT